MSSDYDGENDHDHLTGKIKTFSPTFHGVCVGVSVCLLVYIHIFPGSVHYQAR